MPVPIHSKKMRYGLALGCLALALFCGIRNARHAGLKELPMDPLRLAPAAVAAMFAALLGKRFLGPVAGACLGGIAGAFAVGNLYGPFGGVFGLLIGIAVALLPVLEKKACQNSGTGVPPVI